MFLFMHCIYYILSVLRDCGRHVPPPSFMRVNAESEGMQQKPAPHERPAGTETLQICRTYKLCCQQGWAVDLADMKLLGCFLLHVR